MLWRIFKYSMVSFWLVICLESDAQAYLDPGTGSLLLSMLAAGFVMLAGFWAKICRFIKSIFFKKADG